VVAGFKGHIEGIAHTGFTTDLLERHDLGVIFARSFMVPLGDDLTVTNNHSADGGVRRGSPETSLRQPQGRAHEFLVFVFQLPLM
jgi:hypothetical protein